MDLDKLKDYRALRNAILRLLPYLDSGITELIMNKEKEIWLYKLNGVREKVFDENLDKAFILGFGEQLASFRDLFFNANYPTLNTSIPTSRYRVSMNHFAISADNELSLNIRVPSDKKFDLKAFKLSSICQYDYEYLQNLMIEGKNLLISGGTGSGKTSFLNALIEFIPKHTRIVSVEDSEELDLRAFENHKSLLVDKTESSKFTYENALNMAMRMSPDRLMVGEIDTRPTLNTSIPTSRYRVSMNHFAISADNELSLNIRVPSDKKFDLKAFKLSSICQYDYEYLQNLMIEGKNLLISGGTGSGKTSFLNALIEFIPKHTRIVSVEDSEELDLRAFENHKSLLVDKTESSKFTYENALNMAMRMSPDRLMVGEIDTRNSMLFLRFGNTGHKGMVSTLHADSVHGVIEAIALNLQMNKSGLDVNVAKKFFKSSVDIVVQIVLDKATNTRYIQEILPAKDLRDSL
ncbi:ATPase [Helicobacter pylori NY40]|uniref:ATPase n=4 Tax=Helicobacter pylori TaxID=210 RepID=A0A060PRG4_HELPX|nr:ATPase [Helicobacter pylori NY40]